MAGKRIVNDVAIRARYLDDRIMSFVQQAAGSGPQVRQGRHARVKACA
jgi:hypothetical protein